MREAPQQSAADSQQQGENQKLGAGDALRTAIAVVPGQHQGHEKSDHQREDQQLFELIRPAEPLRDDIEYLDQRERERHISERPLHELAFAQALQQVSHVLLPRTGSKQFMQSPRMAREYTVIAWRRRVYAGIRANSLAGGRRQ